MPASERETTDSQPAAEPIYQGLLTAIMEHRLAAGTKLVEERLCEATGAGRPRIRQVLARLAHEQLVTLVPNKGAFVAQPSVEEARDVFQTRRIIEPELAAMLARACGPAQAKRLREHIAAEHAARERGDRAATIRLSGEYHVLIAEMAGNHVLERLIRETVSRTCLIITLYDRPGLPACPEHEHYTLTEAITAGDAARAHDLMREHLEHIEHSLDLHTTPTSALDLESIFKRA